MKFKCSHCKKIVKYDMRQIPFRGKKRVKSYCENAGKSVFMVRMKHGKQKKK